MTSAVPFYMDHEPRSSSCSWTLVTFAHFWSGYTYKTKIMLVQPLCCESEVSLPKTIRRAATRAGVILLEHFHPGYRKSASHICTVRLTGLIWRGPGKGAGEGRLLDGWRLKVASLIWWRSREIFLSHNEPGCSLLFLFVFVVCIVINTLKTWEENLTLDIASVIIFCPAVNIMIYPFKNAN